MIEQLYSRVRNGSMGLQLGVLLGAVGLMYVVLAPIGWMRFGSWAFAASAVAAGFCLAGGVPALLFSRLFRGKEVLIFGVLLAMGFRMAAPLAGVILLRLSGGPLVKAGFLHYLLGFYLVTLTVETALSVPPRGPSTSDGPPPKTD